MICAPKSSVSAFHPSSSTIEYGVFVWKLFCDIHIAESRSVNCELSFIEFDVFTITVSVMKRGQLETHTAYVVAGPQRATIARASGSTTQEALENLVNITSV